MATAEEEALAVEHQLWRRGRDGDLHAAHRIERDRGRRGRGGDGGGAGVVLGDDLGEDRDGDLRRRARADVEPGGRVQLRAELVGDGEGVTDGRARAGLATSATYGTPVVSASERTRSSSLPCEATISAASPAPGWRSSPEDAWTTS